VNVIAAKVLGGVVRENEEGGMDGRGGYLEIGGASRKYCNMAGLRDEALST
jgi:hypothetical protein